MLGHRTSLSGRLHSQSTTKHPTVSQLHVVPKCTRTVSCYAKGRRRQPEEINRQDTSTKSPVPARQPSQPTKPSTRLPDLNREALLISSPETEGRIPQSKQQIPVESPIAVLESSSPARVGDLAAEADVEDDEVEGEDGAGFGAARSPDWDPWTDPDVLEALRESEIPVLAELTSATHIIINDGFLPDADAHALRRVFDQRFADPRVTHPERFLWDYWHVPDQYTLVRTQAQVYFPEELYNRLEDSLLSYGESQLGCRAISPIWMSYYVDGCVQELHCDNPHGPFAFVLSLTRDWDEREFTGGETMILKPDVLNYWRTYDPRKGLEMQQLVTRVPAPFNRLTVFDPRFPHGVRQVHGTRDPRKSRLVLHGWFTEPAPFFQGPLDPADAEEVLNEGLGSLWDALEGISGLITGTLIVRVRISGRNGSVTSLDWLADTLVEVPNHDRAAAEALLEGRVLPRLRALVHNEVRDCLSMITFPAVPSGEDSVLTYPIIFE